MRDVLLLACVQFCMRACVPSFMCVCACMRLKEENWSQEGMRGRDDSMHAYHDGKIEIQFSPSANKMCPHLKRIRASVTSGRMERENGDGKTHPNGRLNPAES